MKKYCIRFKNLVPDVLLWEVKKVQREVKKDLFKNLNVNPLVLEVRVQGRGSYPG